VGQWTGPYGRLDESTRPRRTPRHTTLRERCFAAFPVAMEATGGFLLGSIWLVVQFALYMGIATGVLLMFFTGPLMLMPMLLLVGFIIAAFGSLLSVFRLL